MKKGQSYIYLSSIESKAHPIIKELMKHGWRQIEIAYASTYSTDAGWTILTAKRNGRGYGGWIGFTKTDAIKNINNWDSLKSSPIN